MLHLDMLRFVASLGIVWHHSHEFLIPVAERSVATERSQALALFVDLFFAISGYVLGQVYSGRLTDRASYGRFLQRRIGRLVPLHWLTLVLSLAFWTMLAQTGITVTTAPDRSAKCIAQVALLLNALSVCGNGYVLNGVTWSISTEMMLYVSFPLILVIMRRGWLLPVGFVALVAGLVMMTGQGERWDNVYPVLRAIPSFFWGLVLFRWRTHLPVIRHSWPVVALTAVWLILMMTGVAQALVLFVVYALVALAVATDQRHDAPPAIWKCAALGQLTYGIYMWHSLFILVMLNAIGDKYLGLTGMNMIVLAAICYATILVWSYLSLRIFEAPARRWIDRL